MLPTNVTNRYHRLALAAHVTDRATHNHCHSITSACSKCDMFQVGSEPVNRQPSKSTCAGDITSNEPSCGPVGTSPAPTQPTNLSGRWRMTRRRSLTDDRLCSADWTGCDARLTDDSRCSVRHGRIDTHRHAGRQAGRATDR